MIRPDPDEFRRTFSRHAEEKRHREFERSQRRIRKTDAAKLENNEDEEFMAVAQAAVEATAESIAAFEAKLTEYEALTVEEIMFLRERIDSLLKEREMLLENAFVLPDGRRVFKTEDGQSVYDEQGKQVSRDIVDPDSIGDDKTSWEAIRRNSTAIERTGQRLEEALEFQGELDDIRESLDKDDLSANELKGLEQRLERSVPTSIRIRQTALEADGEPTKATPEFAAAASGQIDLDTLKIDSPGLGN